MYGAAVQTFVNGWYFALVVNECRQVVDAELLSLCFVVQAYDDDALLLKLVIDILQLVQDAHVLFVAFLVCTEK